MKYYYYFMVGKGLIRIREKIKPRYRHRPYVCYEWSDNQWKLPCFPEIPYSQLRKMTYIGKTNVEEVGDGQ
jgi:hypothetical protein